MGVIAIRISNGTGYTHIKWYRHVSQLCLYLSFIIAIRTSNGIHMPISHTSHALPTLCIIQTHTSHYVSYRHIYEYTCPMTRIFESSDTYKLEWGMSHLPMQHSTQCEWHCGYCCYCPCWRVPRIKVSRIILWHIVWHMCDKCGMSRINAACRA